MNGSNLQWRLTWNTAATLAATLANISAETETAEETTAERQQNTRGAMCARVSPFTCTYVYGEEIFG